MAALLLVVCGKAMSGAAATCARGPQVAVSGDVPRQAGLRAADGAGAGSRKQRDAARLSAAAVGPAHRRRLFRVNVAGTASAPCSEAHLSTRPLYRLLSAPSRLIQIHQ